MLLALLLSAHACAAEPQKPKMVDSKPLEYPEDAKRSGHQGTVVVEVTILANDTISAPVVKISSRSAILDQAAVLFIQRAKYTHGTDEQGNAIDIAVAIPVNFRKDSSADLKEKTCDDFVVDYQWFTKTFPELNVGEMTIYKLTLGLMVLQKTSTDEKLRLARNFGIAFQKTYADCGANRAGKFLPTLLGNIQ
jgi:TonB family protein